MSAVGRNDRAAGFPCFGEGPKRHGSRNRLDLRQVLASGNGRASFREISNMNVMIDAVGGTAQTLQRVEADFELAQVGFGAGLGDHDGRAAGVPGGRDERADSSALQFSIDFSAFG
jgi:hypothetical protein